MYLYKIAFRPEAFRNPYEWHRIIWEYFSGGPNLEREFLFRLEDKVVNERDLVVILQSQQKMQTTAVGQSYVIDGPTKIDVHSIQIGCVYQFKLNANVIKQIHDAENPERRIRVPIIKEQDQVAWLKRKFEKAGELANVNIVSKNNLFFKKKSVKGKLSTVTFEGLIKIHNTEEMELLLKNGVGPAKCFGCGLVSIKKVF